MESGVKEIEQIQDETDEELPIPILLIPEEVRGKIFNKLPQNEALKLRHVCQQFRKDVDNFFDFNLRLDERSPYLDWMFQLRVTKCLIVQLKEPLQISFKHPRLLRSLDNLKTPSHRTEASQTISTANFHALLLHCGQYLQTLSTRVTLPLMRYKVPRTFSYNFESLRKLEVVVDFSPKVGGPINKPKSSPETEDWLIQLFEQSLTPNLESISVQIHHGTYADLILPRCLESMLVCLCRERKATPKVLKVTVVPFLVMPPNNVLSVGNHEFSKVDLPRLQRINSLVELKVCVFLGLGNPLWLQLLACQKKLEYLDIGNHDIRVSATLLQQVVLNNWDTLVSVDIVCLDIQNPRDVEEEKRPLDMSIFQDCHNLKKLSLRSTRRNRVVTPDLINLFYLPLFMTELQLENLTILTDDLVAFSSTQRGLSMLCLRYCGTADHFGLNSVVLGRLMSFQDLRYLKLYQFNTSNPDDTAQLYDMLPKESNWPVSTISQRFIDLLRSSKNHPWMNEGSMFNIDFSDMHR